MEMELNVPVALGIVLVIIAAGTAGLLGMGVMSTNTVLMMVLPSMVVFALVVFGLGVKAGEHRVS
jgi:hypothetical protein